MTELYRPEINKELLVMAQGSALIMSILYDLDLLPEQLASQDLTLRLFAAYNRLEGVLLAFKAMELMADKSKGAGF